MKHMYCHNRRPLRVTRKSPTMRSSLHWRRSLDMHTGPAKTRHHPHKENGGVRLPGYDVCGMTHAGQKDRNEDAYAMVEIADACLLAVADGVGGEAHGDLAAQIAIESVIAAFTGTYRRGMNSKAITELLAAAFAEADLRIRKAAERNGRMGTTLVAAVITNHEAVIANCGDSRAFIMGNGTAFRTREHTLVEVLVELGSIDALMAQKHPLRSVIIHALGINVRVDRYEQELRPGDILVLCSDGLSDEVAGEILSSGTGRDSEEIARKLLQGAIARSDDDVTVVVLKE
ncbi:MAG: family protein phosphatase [Methanofollis sp.]|nr:family protein phosphatase [Methanofollis sp.]